MSTRFREPCTSLAPGGARLNQVLSAGMAQRGPISTVKDARWVRDGTDTQHALSGLLLAKSLGLAPFEEAFDKRPFLECDEKGNAKSRYRVRQVHNPQSGALIRQVTRWIKIGGKNGMEAEDVRVLTETGGEAEGTINATVRQFFGAPGSTSTGAIFDGDNYEPDTAPFSGLIARLIEAGYPVVAVKSASAASEQGLERPKVSNSFRTNWMQYAEAHPTFVMALMTHDTVKEDVSLMADAFVFWGSTYHPEGGKDYRYRPDGSNTQGYKEVLALQADPKVQSSISGRGEHTFVATRFK